MKSWRKFISTQLQFYNRSYNNIFFYLCLKYLLFSLFRKTFLVIWTNFTKKLKKWKEKMIWCLYKTINKHLKSTKTILKILLENCKKFVKYLNKKCFIFLHLKSSFRNSFFWKIFDSFLIYSQNKKLNSIFVCLSVKII